MKIFLSYSHQNKTEADRIDSFFQTQGYTIVRDIRNVAFKDDLHDFCDQIRECQAAITLLSDPYLKSRWCMYEILQLLKDRDFKAKIFPVVMDDAHIFTEEDRLDYTRYWHDKYDTLHTKTTGLDLSA